MITRPCTCRCNTTPPPFTAPSVTDEEFWRDLRWEIHPDLLDTLVSLITYANVRKMRLGIRPEDV